MVGSNNAMWIGLLVCLLIGVNHGATVSDKVSIAINTHTNPRSEVVPPYFASFSNEWSIIHYFSGSSAVNLFNLLKQWTGSAPYVRVGGNSADTSFYNPNNAATPSGWFSITDAILTNLNVFAQQTGSKLILGLNFHSSDNASLAISELQAISKRFDWSTIHALEVGNEQDLYRSNGIRLSNYSAAQYQSEFEYYVSQLTTVAKTGVTLPTNKIFQGGAICCRSDFENAIPAFMTAEKATTLSYSQHYYTGNACDSVPTLSSLLTPGAISRAKTEASTYVPVAKSLGLEFWFGESNSVACSGALNASDVFGSSLWGLDYMLAMAQLNVTGINFHWGGYYSAFYATWTMPNVVMPRGLFYAMWFFVQTVRNSSVILIPSIDSTSAYITSYVALSTVDSTLRVVIVNKDIKTTNTTEVVVDVSQSGNYNNTAQLIRLLGDSPYTQYSITLAGQTFFNTTNGIPTGTRTTIPVVGANGTYTFSMPPASAAMLEITLAKSTPTSTTSTTKSSTTLASSTTVKASTTTTKATTSTTTSVTSTTTSGSPTYLGCYNDSSARDLPFHLIDSSSMTIEKCRYGCGLRFYQYAGLEAGKQCFCGNTYGSHGRVADSQCSSRCSGNSAERCGSGWKLSIYTSYSNSDVGFVGCFVDSGKRDMSFLNFQLTNTTIDYCRMSCYTLNYSYAGLQNANQCFCGNSYGSKGQAAASDCSMACSGDPTEICGAGYRNSVYKAEQRNPGF